VTAACQARSCPGFLEVECITRGFHAAVRIAVKEEQTLKVVDPYPTMLVLDYSPGVHLVENQFKVADGFLSSGHAGFPEGDG
jgi:hypothetical protein